MQVTRTYISILDLGYFWGKDLIRQDVSTKSPSDCPSGCVAASQGRGTLSDLGSPEL